MMSWRAARRPLDLATNSLGITCEDKRLDKFGKLFSRYSFRH